MTVPLAPHEFDALVSFHYNTGGIARASADPPPERRRPGGRGAGLPELAAAGGDHPRREAERDLFRHGRYPGGPIPVWSVDRTGRVDFSRPVRRLAESEALALLRPSQPDAPVTPTPTGWLARLAAFFSTLIRRA